MEYGEYVCVRHGLEAGNMDPKSPHVVGPGLAGVFADRVIMSRSALVGESCHTWPHDLFQERV